MSGAGRTGGWGLVVPALFMLATALAAGCSATARGGDPSVETYPRWLIAVADPVAPVVGLAISMVVWRSGHLHAREEALARLGARLRPLDVLLFSSKGRLSGHTGSGLFGHSAVYLGTERELRALGLWNDPAVVPHHAAIRAGRTVIESAMRHGVELSTLETVADTDRVVQLRPRARARGAASRSLVAYFGMVGGRFDHHFRAEEHSALYCTELVQLGMPGLSLPRRRAYGRDIILPDDIALAAVDGRSGLSVVTYLRADRSGWEEARAAALAADIGAAAN